MIVLPFRDAEDAVHGRDGYDLDGYKIRVEFPRECFLFIFPSVNSVDVLSWISCLVILPGLDGLLTDFVFRSGALRGDRDGRGGNRYGDRNGSGGGGGGGRGGYGDRRFGGDRRGGGANLRRSKYRVIISGKHVQC